jgi:uncharacterized membrane protein YfcA
MEIYFGFILAFIVGLSLGLIGSGGSILTVPILIYVVGIDVITATGYSLFIVGSTALVGAVRSGFDKQINYRSLLLFGIPSMAAAYFSRAILIPALPEVLLSKPFPFLKSQFLLLLFTLVMFVAAVKMIKAKIPKEGTVSVTPLALIAVGLLVGVLAGAVGAGGGFLIIPALVFLAGLQVKRAIGTSLSIITLQSLAGFLGDANFLTANWQFLSVFSATSVVGLFFGLWLNKKADANKLKVAFGYIVLIMALFIFMAEWQKIKW